jgi:hypothetical protein
MLAEDLSARARDLDERAFGALSGRSEASKAVYARWLAPYARAAAVAAAQIAALSLAMIKDGAPTHHPERAVLAALLLCAIAGGALAAHMLGDAVDGGGAAGRRAITVGKGIAIAGAVALSAWVGRRGEAGEGFAERSDEEAIGRAAAAVARPGERVLVEVVDYGYLAVIAALGRPEDAVADRSVDPRDAEAASSFTAATALRQRLALAGARWAAARVAGPVRDVMGAPVATRGAWGVFAVVAPP